jgi:hypothetical protein
MDSLHTGSYQTFRIVRAGDGAPFWFWERGGGQGDSGRSDSDPVTRSRHAT